MHFPLYSFEETQFQCAFGVEAFCLALQVGRAPLENHVAAGLFPLSILDDTNNQSVHPTEHPECRLRSSHGAGEP